MLPLTDMVNKINLATMGSYIHMASTGSDIFVIKPPTMVKLPIQAVCIIAPFWWAHQSPKTEAPTLKFSRDKAGDWSIVRLVNDIAIKAGDLLSNAKDDGTKK